MKPRFSFFAVAIVALAIGFAAASCDDDPTQPAEKPKLELVAPAGETLSLGAADTESEVRFLCTGKWTATFDAEGTAWLTVSPQEGKGASEVQTVALSMDRNTSGQSRQGVLTIRSAGTTPVEIKVTQAAGEAGEETFELLDPGQSRIEADPEGEQIELAFLSGAAWTAKASVPDWVEDKSWLTVSPTSGEGDAEVQTVLLTVKKIPGSESLSGTVTLASGERKIVVEVEQAAPSYYCELLDPEQSEIEVSAEGGDIQVYFRCNNTWLATTDNSVREWFSVMPPMGDPSEAASVTLSVKPNPTTEPREAVAQLIAGDFDKPLKIRVTQAGMTGPVEIIEFPDPVLKERLVQSYDTNGDGEIDTAEAKAVTTLSVTYAATKIENLEGLQYLTELESLTLENQAYPEIDLTPFEKLRTASVKINKSLVSVKVAGNASLTSLNITNTGLTSLDLTGCTAMETLVCGSLGLTSFDFLTGGESLRTIESNFNKLSALDLSRFENLESLTVTYNEGDISQVDFSGNPHLASLSISNTRVPTAVDLSGCAALQNVKLEACGITELRLPEDNPSLGGLFLAQNELSELSVKNAPALETLKCSTNHLSRLDLTGCTGLEILDARYNELTEVILDGCRALSQVELGDNRLSDASFLYGCAETLASIGLENNSIAAFDPSLLPEMHDLDLQNNLISGELDVTGMPAMNMSVNVTQNPDLKKLYVSAEQVASMDMPMTRVILKWDKETCEIVVVE